MKKEGQSFRDFLYLCTKKKNQKIIKTKKKKKVKNSLFIKITVVGLKEKFQNTFSKLTKKIK